MKLQFVRVSLIGILLILTLLVFGCSETTIEEEDALRIGEPLDEQPTLVAVIASQFGSDTLSTAAFEDRLQRLTEMFPQVMLDPDQLPTVKAGIVNQFVMDHLLVGEADRRGLSITSEQVDQELVRIRGQFESDSAFQAAIGPNVSDEDLREMVSRDMLPRVVLGAMMEDVAEPTDEQIREFAEEQSKQISAQHILFLVGEGADKAENARIEERARVVLDSALSGVDFPTLAQRHSEDPGSATRGGDLGFFRRGDMVAPFEEAAFALRDNGDITEDLVETSYGYHIIRLVETRTEDIPPENAGTILHQRMQQEAQRDGVRGLKEQAEVRLNATLVAPDLIMRN